MCIRDRLREQLIHSEEGKEEELSENNEMETEPTLDGSEIRYAALTGVGDMEVEPRENVILEFCCDPNSMLGRTAHEFPGHSVIRLTEQDDMTTEAGLLKALRVVNRVTRPALVVALPCTGWSSWQAINLARADRTNNQTLKANHGAES